MGSRSTKIIKTTFEKMKEKRKSFMKAVKLLVGKKKQENYQEYHDKVLLNKTYSLPVNASLNDSNIYDLKHERVQRKGSTLQYFAPSSNHEKFATNIYHIEHHSNDVATDNNVRPKYHSVKVRERKFNAEIVKSHQHHQNSNHSNSTRKFSIKRFKGRKELVSMNQSLPNLSEDTNLETKRDQNQDNSFDTIDFATKEMF